MPESPPSEQLTATESAQLIGARIRSACLRRGWDAARLAEKAGISRTTLYHLEQGTTGRPRISTLCKVAAALEIPAEHLCSPAAIDRPVPRPERDLEAEREKQRRFDRDTNTLVDDVCRESPEFFSDWSAADWDELYSEFGTGGKLTREGVVLTVGRMNRKRETIQQLQVVLETHLHDVAANMVETLYRMVQPSHDVATAPQLTALLGPDRLQSP